MWLSTGQAEDALRSLKARCARVGARALLRVAHPSYSLASSSVSVSEVSRCARRHGLARGALEGRAGTNFLQMVRPNSCEQTVGELNGWRVPVQVEHKARVQRISTDDLAGQGSIGWRPSYSTYGKHHLRGTRVAR